MSLVNNSLFACSRAKILCFYSHFVSKVAECMCFCKICFIKLRLVRSVCTFSVLFRRKQCKTHVFRDVVDEKHVKTQHFRARAREKAVNCERLLFFHGLAPVFHVFHVFHVFGSAFSAGQKKQTQKHEKHEKHEKQEPNHEKKKVTRN